MPCFRPSKRGQMVRLQHTPQDN